MVGNLIHKCQPVLLLAPTSCSNSNHREFSFTWVLYGGLRWERSGVKLKMNCCHLRMCCRGGENDGLYCFSYKKTHFFFCNGVIYFSSNILLNCNSNRNPEAARRIPRTTNPPSITPHLCTNWQNITSTIYFILFLTLHKPELCTPTVTWASARYCNSRDRNCVCVAACVCVCICV